MRLLLDTHVAIWAILDDPRLTLAGRALIIDPSNTVVVSVASIWEIAIKHALARTGANAMPLAGDEALADFRASGYDILAITAEHATAVSSLPAHHADPFDRLLVAQASVETLRLVTADRRVAAYDLSTVML